MQSDWSRSDLHGSFKGGYTDYFASPADNAPYGSGTLDGRLDVTRDLSLDAEGRFNISTQTLTSLGLTSTTATTSNPLVETYGGTIGGAQKFGLFTLGLHGTFDRTAYEDATLADGLLFPLSTDDYNDFGLKARASYELSPAISPFVEIDVDARRYDDGVDYAGYARNSNGVAGLAGASLAFNQQLTGEASLGYGERSYDDPRLPDMRSPLIDVSLIWTATPLTTVTGKATTTLADTVTPGASGSVQRAYTIDVAHSLTRALTLGASAGYSSDDYVGVSLRDWTTTFGATRRIPSFARRRPQGERVAPAIQVDRAQLELCRRHLPARPALPALSASPPTPQDCALPTVSATTAPRAPSGLSLSAVDPTRSGVRSRHWLRAKQDHDRGHPHPHHHADACAQRTVCRIVIGKIGQIPREQSGATSQLTAAKTLPTVSHRQRGSRRLGPYR